MGRIARVTAAALVALGCGCSTPVFEDVGLELHPPSLQLLGIAYQPPLATGEPDPVLTFMPPEAFVVHVGVAGKDTAVIQVSYQDAGADIDSFFVRDRQSDLLKPLSPAAPEVDLDGDGVLDTLEAPDFFVGTVGLADLRDIQFTGTQGGVHHLELWAEDSLGARSEKIEFTLLFEI